MYTFRAIVIGKTCRNAYERRSGSHSREPQHPAAFLFGNGLLIMDKHVHLFLEFRGKSIIGNILIDHFVKRLIESLFKRFS